MTEQQQVDRDAPIESFAALDETPAVITEQESVEAPPLEEVSEEELPPTEQEARKLGWKPKEEWKGKTDGWKPAEDFLEEKKDSIKTLKNTVDRQDRNIQAILEHTRRQEAFQAEQIKKVREEAYNEAMINLETRLAEAYKEGDFASAQRLNTAKENLVRADEASKMPTPSMVPEQNPVIQDWKTKNDWYGKDDHMTLLADGISQKHKNLSFEDQLAKVDEEVKKAFPYKFQQRARIANNTTLATSQKTVVKKPVAPNSYEALSPEWRKEADKFVEASSRNTPKDKAMAEYLKYLPADAFNN